MSQNKHLRNFITNLRTLKSLKEDLILCNITNATSKLNCNKGYPPPPRLYNLSGNLKDLNQESLPTWDSDVELPLNHRLVQSGIGDVDSDQCHFISLHTIGQFVQAAAG